MGLLVSLEVHDERTFASALEGPGWCRSAGTEQDALEVLAAYASRYRLVAERAGLRLGARTADEIDVVERLPGDATTSFGEIEDRSTPAP